MPFAKGNKAAKKSPAEKRGAFFGFAASKKEAAKIRSAAKKAGFTVSEFLRSAAMAYRGFDGTDGCKDDMQ